MMRFVSTCALAACGCGEVFTSFGDSSGAGGGQGVGGEAGVSTASGALHSPVGSGGSTEGCQAPEGWQSVATDCDEPGLELGVEANGAECEACACGDWRGECDVAGAALRCWLASQGSCPGVPPWEGDGAETCQPGPPATGEFHNCELAAAPADGGCESSGGELVEASPWSSTLSICDGCGCLAREGEHDCPDRSMVRTVGYAEVVDGRECSACSCSGSGSCASKAIVSNDCDGQIALVEATCVGVNYQANWVFNVEATPPTSCEAAGGQPSGAVAPESSWTVCCPEL